VVKLCYHQLTQQNNRLSLILARCEQRKRGCDRARNETEGSSQF